MSDKSGDRREGRFAVFAAIVLNLVATPALADPAADAELVRALRANDTAAADTALAHHADPNRSPGFAAGPLAYAVNAQNPALVALLLAKGARPDTADIDGVTPLSLACELGNGDIVTALLARVRMSARAGPMARRRWRSARVSPLPPRSPRSWPKALPPIRATAGARPR